MLYVTFKDLLLLKLNFNKYINSYYNIKMDTYYFEHLAKHCLWYLIYSYFDFNTNSHSHHRFSLCLSGGHTMQFTSISGLNSFANFFEYVYLTRSQGNSPRPFLILAFLVRQLVILNIALSALTSHSFPS